MLCYIEIPGIDGIYEALQFHVHASSEHTIDGSYFDAELHIVPKATNSNRYAVVSFVIDPSAPVYFRPLSQSSTGSCDMRHARETMVIVM
jgi:carbonic anhydrase